LHGGTWYGTFTTGFTSPEATAVYLAASGRKLTILSILSKNENFVNFAAFCG
jgi:hypothetical protein